MVDYFNDVEFVKEEGEIGNACQWLVDKTIPLGDYTIIGATPGAGKSFLLQMLAADVVCGDPFMDFPTMEGDVLIIDEDNDNAVKVKRRIHRLIRGREQKHQLFCCIREGYAINKGDTRSLKSLINRPEYANVILVIIDSLTAIAGAGTDMDSTSGSSKLIDGLRELTNPKRATVVVHHISAKNPITIEDLQRHQHPDQLIMNGTRIVSACSDLLVIASKTKTNKTGEKVLDEIYVKTHSRRDILRADFRVGIRDINDDILLMFPIAASAPELTFWQDALLSHFPLEEAITMPELFKACRGMASPSTMYAERDNLVKLGYIDLLKKRGTAGKHYFRLSALGQEWYYTHHDFTDDADEIKKGNSVPLSRFFKKSEKKKESDNNASE
jgi:AAA domain